MLRVRLLKEEEEYISTCELYDFIELKCKPLFPHQIIDIQLVVLTMDFVTQLDSHGNKIMLKERYGLLLPNILDGNYEKHFLSKHCQLYTGCTNNIKTNNNLNKTKTTHDTSQIDSVIFEIKPKWLYDNTSSNYCRTCLLNQHRNQTRHFCPLDLLYPDTLERGLEDIFQLIPTKTMSEIEQDSKFPIKSLFRIFLSNPENVFQKLKQYQRIANKNDLIKNLGSAADVLHNLLLVMTLRDVGLFIKFEKYNRDNNIHNSHNNVHNLIDVEGHGKFLLTCNIYDLDLKSKMKYRHWFEVEQQLQGIYGSINEEWRFCTKRDIKNNLEK